MAEPNRPAAASRTGSLVVLLMLAAGCIAAGIAYYYWTNHVTQAADPVALPAANPSHGAPDQ